MWLQPDTEFEFQTASCFHSWLHGLSLIRNNSPKKMIPNTEPIRVVVGMFPSTIQNNVNPLCCHFLWCWECMKTIGMLCLFLPRVFVTEAGVSKENSNYRMWFWFHEYVFSPLTACYHTTIISNMTKTIDCNVSIAKSTWTNKVTPVTV